MNILATISNIIALTLTNVQQSLLSAGTAISGWLLVAAIGIAGLGWAFRRSNIIVTGGLAALGSILVIMSLAASQFLGEMLMSGVVQLGLRAGGSGLSVDTFLSTPDAWLQSGWSAAQRLADFGNVAPTADDILLTIISTSAGLRWAFYAASWFVYLVFAIAAVIMIASMFFYKIALALSMITLPLAVVGVTRKFGLAPLNFAMQALASMFALTFVLSLSSNLMTRVNADIPSDLTFLSVLPPVVASIFIIISVFTARHLAQSMMGAGITSIGNMAAPVLIAGEAAKDSFSGSVRGAISGSTMGPAGTIAGGVAGGVSGALGGHGRTVAALSYLAPVNMSNASVQEGYPNVRMPPGGYRGPSGSPFGGGSQKGSPFGQANPGPMKQT